MPSARCLRPGLGPVAPVAVRAQLRARIPVGHYRGGTSVPLLTRRGASFSCTFPLFLPREGCVARFIFLIVFRLPANWVTGYLTRELLALLRVLLTVCRLFPHKPCQGLGRCASENVFFLAAIPSLPFLGFLDAEFSHLRVIQ